METRFGEAIRAALSALFDDSMAAVVRWLLASTCAVSPFFKGKREGEGSKEIGSGGIEGEFGKRCSS